MNTSKLGTIAGGLLMMVMPMANAADVNITLNGKVVAKPCTVSTVATTVDLGDLYTFNLLSPGAYSAWQPVTLNLTHCPVGTTKVTATFSGTADSSRNYYANQGAARNIALQLVDSGGVNLANGSRKTVGVSNASRAASFVLRVRAITPNGNATQGSLQAVINVTYTYA